MPTGVVLHTHAAREKRVCSCRTTIRARWSAENSRALFTVEIVCARVPTLILLLVGEETAVQPDDAELLVLLCENHRRGRPAAENVQVRERVSRVSERLGLSRLTSGSGLLHDENRTLNIDFRTLLFRRGYLPVKGGKKTSQETVNQSLFLEVSKRNLARRIVRRFCVSSV